MEKSLKLTIQDLLVHLKMAGIYNQALREILARKYAEAKAIEMGIKVTDKELQKVADEFRKQYKLEKANKFHDWLKINDMSIEDFEKCIERDILISKLDEPVTDDDLEEVETIFVLVEEKIPKYSISDYTFLPYSSPKPLKPDFNPYAESNAVAGIRG